MSRRDALDETRVEEYDDRRRRAELSADRLAGQIGSRTRDGGG
jgi:hypothetical protein